MPFISKKILLCMSLPLKINLKYLAQLINAVSSGEEDWYLILLFVFVSVMTVWHVAKAIRKLLIK